MADIFCFQRTIYEGSKEPPLINRLTDVLWSQLARTCKQLRQGRPDRRRLQSRGTTRFGEEPGNIERRDENLVNQDFA